MPTAQPLRTGDPQRLGEYELSGRLGEGGQGAVFLGSRGGETYAVKLLHGPVGDERAAFLREVELAKHVARFCTAQVIDAGFDEGRAYIVSEYVDGPSLQREVALTGPRRGGALERLAVGTATAIVAIHRAGIVHRDFKPQNVLLGSDGPRVIDFGLARALDAAATVSGRGVGTPAYMAPEQITASLVTGKADVFSWGATMCFAANATAPFGQDSVAPVLHRILTAPPELGRLEGRLRTIVAACLDKDARNRPTSRELLFELLGQANDLPPEVLASPPPHILRQPPPSLSDPIVPDPCPASGTPLAHPEATDAPGGYYLPATSSPKGHPPPTSADEGPPPPAPGIDPPPTARGTTAWPRAAIAVCAALLATAAVLLAIVIPALNNDEPRQSPQGAGTLAPPKSSEPPRTPSSTEKPRSPDKPKQTQEARNPPINPPPTAAPVAIVVPPLTGLTKSAATKAVRRAGLILGPITRLDSPQKIGQVLTTNPASGTMVSKGSRVSLQLSAGLPVPSVIGVQRKPAEAALTKAGLSIGPVTRTCSDKPTGQVLSTTPKPGSRVTGTTPVALTLSRRGAPVPSVVGQPEAGARAALTAAGLTVRARGKVVEDEARVGTILSQTPGPSACAPPGSPVVIVVGLASQSGPDPTEPTETPTGAISGT